MQKISRGTPTKAKSRRQEKRDGPDAVESMNVREGSPEGE